MKGERWLSGNANPKKEADGSILWHGYIHDVTELKTKETEFARAAKMATLGQMSASIAHEINNPLSVITMSAQQALLLFKKGELDNDKFLNHIEKIKDTTSRISKIIKGLKFFTNSNMTNDYEKITIEKLVSETAALCLGKFQEHKINFKLDLAPIISKQLIECRPVEISQVLLNLLNNAFDAIESKENPWIEMSVSIHNEKVKFTVKDCGDGISPLEMNKILNPFYTTKSAGKGTGLGLSISQRLIENHGGRLWIDSESSNTCFVFEIPHVQMPVA
jgi:C4-dicarboxylate-specific signal transduction histidine kinase